MKRKLTALISATAIIMSLSGCGDKESNSSKYIDTSSGKYRNSVKSTTSASTEPEPETEPETEPVTEHISPVENMSVKLGTQIQVNKTIERTEGSNTIKLPLADFIEEGDVISSFTFVIYSADGYDIGTFKGGCGISVNSDCTAATDEGWYQSDDFTSSTQGTYGEITWEVPSNIRDYVSAGGEVLFGYWWGNAGSIRVDSVICTYTRTRDIPVDGTLSQQVGKSVNYDDADNMITVPLDFLPENSVPQAVTFNISSSGGFGKFTGAFACEASGEYYQSSDVAIFTDNSSLSLTWFLPQSAKKFLNEEGEVLLGYWWGGQSNMELDSIEVKYSQGSGSSSAAASEKNEQAEESDNNTSESASGFRSASQIVSDIKAGWNLGNTLECYDYGDWTDDAETAWGNLKTTSEMIGNVKSAGFNAIRIPVTWGEHMSEDVIDSEWLDRVQEVVDYAYDSDMFVILNMHHDDYIWFNPTESEYGGDSARLKKIWEQISERFKDYGDRLLFEGMNEPRTIDSANEWMGGTAEERAVINKYEQDFVDTVRSSGGNNADRTLIVTTYAASAETVALNDSVIPDDKNIILSVHYYAPWRFSEGMDTVFGDSQKSELDSKFAELKQKFIDKGTPVIIGEFGCINEADEATRAEYYEYYISSAKSQGIKCFVWDNGVASGEASYGIFNRGLLTWNTAILDGIMNGAK